MREDEIGLIAVNKVEEAAYKTNRLIPEINKNDTKISWDGLIYIYNDSNKERRPKTDFAYKIDVQVKGHKVHKLKAKGKSKYSIEVADLENYQKDGKGTLLLVVEMTDKYSYKMYYANLLPVDLKEILKSTKKEQKTKTITIKPIVERSSASLENVCINFMNNSKIQMKSIILSRDEINKIGMPTKMQSEVVLPSNEDWVNYVLDNEMYFYMQKGEATFALPKLKTTSITQRKKCEVSVNGKKYYDEYEIIKDDNGKEMVKFGKSVMFQRDISKMKITNNGSIYERINDINFAIEVLKNEYIMLGEKGERISFKNEKKNKEEFNKKIKKLSEKVNQLEEIKNSFEKYGVKFNQDLNELNNNDWNNIENLVLCYKDKPKISIDKIEAKYVKIGNYKIALLFVKENEKIRCYNLFGEHVFDKYIVTLGETRKIITTPYINLKTDNFIEFSNLNTQVIKGTIEKISPNDFKKQLADMNFYMLEVLQAYDKCKKSELLSLAEYISDKILKCDDEKEGIEIINKAQIEKRKGKITKEIQDDLYNIRTNNNDAKIQCAIAILLGNRMDFNRFFDKMPKDTKEVFVKYPIYNLLEKDNLG